jgi:hypothetical protein
MMRRAWAISGRPHLQLFPNRGELLAVPVGQQHQRRSGVEAVPFAYGLADIACRVIDARFEPPYLELMEYYWT